MSNVPKKRVASSAFGNRWLLFHSYREKIVTGKRGEAQPITFLLMQTQTPKQKSICPLATSYSSNALINKLRTILTFFTAENAHCHFVSLLNDTIASQVRNATSTWMKTNDWKTNSASNEHTTVRQFLTCKH